MGGRATQKYVRATQKYVRPPPLPLCHTTTKTAMLTMWTPPAFSALSVLHPLSRFLFPETPCRHFFRSPIYAHFTETLGGLSAIRAFGHVNLFARTNERLVDNNLSTHFALMVLARGHLSCKFFVFLDCNRLSLVVKSGRKRKRNALRNKRSWLLVSALRVFRFGFVGVAPFRLVGSSSRLLHNHAIYVIVSPRPMHDATSCVILFTLLSPSLVNFFVLPALILPFV